MSERLGPRPPEVVEAEMPRARELTTEPELGEFFLTYRRNNHLTIPDAARERRMAEIQAREALRRQRDANIFFFGIEQNKTMVGTGNLTIHDEGGERR